VGRMSLFLQSRRDCATEAGGGLNHGDALFETTPSLAEIEHRVAAVSAGDGAAQEDLGEQGCWAAIGLVRLGGGLP